MSLREEECVITPQALDAIIEKYKDTTGIRDLEQAAEHVAAHALYQIEVNHLDRFVYGKEQVIDVLG